MNINASVANRIRKSFRFIKITSIPISLRWLNLKKLSHLSPLLHILYENKKRAQSSELRAQLKDLKNKKRNLALKAKFKSEAF